jgi:DNA-binding CsgD family transcriptional regulator
MSPDWAGHGRWMPRCVRWSPGWRDNSLRSTPPTPPPWSPRTQTPSTWSQARSRRSGSTYWRPRRPSRQHALIAPQGAVPAPSPRAAGPQATLVAACEGAHTPALDLLIHPPDLTPREQEIAGLAARGLSSRAIAERLVISVRTVDNALQHVYGKLGLTSRAEPRVALGRDSAREQPPE